MGVPDIEPTIFQRGPLASRQTNLIARGAYHKAILDELLDADFQIDLGVLATEAEKQTSPFFVALMLVKALQVENITQRNSINRSYMVNTEDLRIWNFAKYGYSPVVALKALKRICPYLRINSINSDIQNALHTDQSLDT
jgi:hypothetical protein